MSYDVGYVIEFKRKSQENTTDVRTDDVEKESEVDVEQTKEKEAVTVDKKDAQTVCLRQDRNNCPRGRRYLTG